MKNLISKYPLFSFFFLAFLEVVYVLSLWIGGKRESLAPGWSSLMFVLLVVGGSIMIMLGFVGIYIGFIFQEVKRRPIYITRSTTAAAAESQPTQSDQGNQ